MNNNNQSESLDQPWPHPFQPSTASDGAGHIEINPSMLSPTTMTPPQTDLDRLNELEAKATPGPWNCIPTDGIIHGDICIGEFHHFRFEDDTRFVTELRNAFPAIAKELTQLHAQLAASQESERRMRGLVKKSIDYLRDVFGQDPAELRAELEAALLTTPVKAEGDDGRIYPCEKCGVMRTKAEGGTTFTVCDDCWDVGKPTTPPADEIGGEAS